ncbi:pentapeptide repeat-containing protein [Ferrovibrio sp.]|uniref:pentapeptide repeat-containing protein n=1 Tax=Ferrovibrio sp. TaxID=1917215 RepID=UPI003D2E02E2
MAELNPDEAPPKAPVELPALRSALDSNASLVRTIYLAFLAFCLYVAALAGSTTHEQLLRGKAPKIPFVDIELPVTGIYFVAPLLLLLFHFNLLLHLHFLARAAWQFRDRLHSQVNPNKPAHREQYEDNLDILNSSPFVYMLIGLHLKPGMRTAVRLMMGLTVLIAPPVVLLVVQGAFLPYHHEWLHDFHTLIIIADLIMVVVLWDFCVTDPKPKADDNAWWRRGHWPTLLFVLLFIAMVALSAMHSGWWAAATMVLAPVASLFDLPRNYRLALQAVFAVAIIATVTFGSYRPFGGIGDRYLAGFNGNSLTWTADLEAEHLLLAAFPMDRDSLPYKVGRLAGTLLRGVNPIENLEAMIERLRHEKPGGVWKRTLQPNRIIIFSGSLQQLTELEMADPAKRHDPGSSSVKKTNIGIDLSGRDLRGADFTGAKLSSARFSSADLTFASFRRADITNAVFVSVLRTEKLSTKMDGVTLTDAMAQGANFSGVNLRAARMVGGDFRKARFTSTDLSWSDLTRAGLSEADLRWATLIGGRLHEADVARANFGIAEIKHADLRVQRFGKNATPIIDGTDGGIQWEPFLVEGNAHCPRPLTTPTKNIVHRYMAEYCSPTDNTEADAVIAAYYQAFRTELLDNGELCTKPEILSAFFSIYLGDYLIEQVISDSAKMNDEQLEAIGLATLRGRRLVQELGAGLYEKLIDELNTRSASCASISMMRWETILKQ